jgi:S1-C subfamily serine protease
VPDDEGTGFSGAPLPPEDRLWRHPSEVRPPSGGPGRRFGLVTLGIGIVVGASATFVGLWAGGAFESAPRSATAEERLATPVSTVFVGRDAGGGIDQVAEGLVAIRAGAVDGSGVVLRDDGHVLTTADLVGDQRHVRVWDVDGTERQGDVVGLDPATDVAVLSVPGLTSSGAVLGTSQGLVVGDPARAVHLERQGAALVLTGMVANLAVTVSRDDDTVLHGLISTDIVLTQPVEGAALVDTNGAVVGVTTGVGDTDALRAVPIDLARIVAHDIIATGGPDHPWLGIEGRDLDADRAADWGIAGGAQLVAVVEESPADVAGLLEDDVVTHVGDTAVTSMGDLVTALRHHDPGDRVRLGYLRDGAPQWCAAVLAPTT